nr:zinc finger, CCHC-type [Tanacetum cinerariifolium]
VHKVHDEKHVWFEVELRGAQKDREAEVFHVSNDDTAVAQRWNMGFYKSGEYKKTFIGSGIGTGLIQVLHGIEFEVEPLGDHTFEVEPQGNIDQGAGLQKNDMDAWSDVYVLSNGYRICSDDSDGYYWEYTPGDCDVEKNGSLKANLQHMKSLSTTEAGYMMFTEAWKKEIWLKRLLTESRYELRLVACIATSALVKVVPDVYVLSNGYRICSDDSDGYYWEYTPGMFIHLFLYIDDMIFSYGYKAEIWATKGLLDKAKGNVLGMEIVRDQSGNTLRVSQSRYYNGKLV